MRGLISRPESREIVEPEDSRFLSLAALAAVAAWIVSRLVIFVSRVIFFDGMAADGPFQMFNALRRLSAGQIAGRDFPVFHGLGVPWLHYPLFRLFGEGLFGSEMSRQLTSLTLCTAAMAMMLRIVTVSWRRVTLRLALVLILEETLGLSGLGRFADAGNSMTDLRGLAPLIGATVYATARSRWLRVTLLSACLGVAPLLGVDQAPPFFLAVTGVALILLIRHCFTGYSGSLQIIAELMISLACGLALAAGLMLLISGVPGMMAALKFNFVESPGDQFWYFGVPPNSYFSSAAELLTQPHSIPILVSLVTAGMSLTCLMRRPDLLLRRAGCAILLCYGLLSMTPALGYMGQYMRHGIAAILLSFFISFGETASGWLLRFRRPLQAGLLAFALFQTALATRKLIPLARAPDLHSVHFSEKWKDIISTGEDLIHRYRLRGKTALWSTYASELNSRVGEFLPAEDYVIHALGPERRAHYLAAFQAASPAVAMTISFPLMEQWVQNETWGLYEELLTHYFVARRAGNGVAGAVYWVRNEPHIGLASRTQGTARLVDESHFVIEPPVIQPPVIQPAEGRRARLGTVSIHYGIRYSSGFERFLSKMARYLITGDSPGRTIPVSLAPYATEWRFPVVTRDLPVNFGVSTSGVLAGGRVCITSVSVEWWPEDAPVSLFDAAVNP